MPPSRPGEGRGAEQPSSRGALETPDASQLSSRGAFDFVTTTSRRALVNPAASQPSIREALETPEASQPSCRGAPENPGASQPTFMRFTQPPKAAIRPASGGLWNSILTDPVPTTDGTLHRLDSDSIVPFLKGMPQYSSRRPTHTTSGRNYSPITQLSWGLRLWFSLPYFFAVASI